MKKFKFSFLIMAMLVLMLAACSGGKQTAGDDKEPAQNDDTEKVEDVAEVEDEAEDERKKKQRTILGGRVIKIANHWDMTPLAEQRLVILN